MTDRRQVLLNSLLLSFGTGTAIASPANAAVQRAFAPDKRPMIYQRKLVRSLAGGGAIEVTRQFEIQFVNAADGFTVQGKQTDVSVHAPAALRALAEIERRREERGLFPLALDLRGLIRDGPSITASEATRVAVEKANAMLTSTDIVSDPVLYRQFLSQVQNTAAQFMSRLPNNLFVPSAEPTISRRSIPLPGQMTGEIEVVFKGAASSTTGLMTAARREVTTRIGNDSRTAQEAWSLTPK